MGFDAGAAGAYVIDPAGAGIKGAGGFDAYNPNTWNTSGKGGGFNLFNSQTWGGSPPTTPDVTQQPGYQQFTSYGNAAAAAAGLIPTATNNTNAAAAGQVFGQGVGGTAYGQSSNAGANTVLGGLAMGAGPSYGYLNSAAGSLGATAAGNSPATAYSQTALNYLGNAAASNGPTAADATLKAGLNADIAAAQSTAASTRGDFGLAGAQKTAAGQESQAIQNTGNQAAILRANEMNAALGQYAGAAGAYQNNLTGAAAALGGVGGTYGSLQNNAATGYAGATLGTAGLARGYANDLGQLGIAQENADVGAYGNMAGIYGNLAGQGAGLATGAVQAQQQQQQINQNGNQAGTFLGMGGSAGGGILSGLMKSDERLKTNTDPFKFGGEREDGFYSLGRSFGSLFRKYTGEHEAPAPASSDPAALSYGSGVVDDRTSAASTPMGVTSDEAASRLFGTRASAPQTWGSGEPAVVAGPGGQLRYTNPTATDLEMEKFGAGSYGDVTSDARTKEKVSTEAYERGLRDALAVKPGQGSQPLPLPGTTETLPRNYVDAVRHIVSDTAGPQRPAYEDAYARGWVPVNATARTDTAPPGWQVSQNQTPATPSAPVPPPMALATNETSDERLKRGDPGLKGYGAALEQLNHFRPETFRYKDPRMAPNPEAAGAEHVGIMAQDAEQGPAGATLVRHSGPAGIRSLDTPAMVGALAAGAGALKARTDEHAERLDRLERMLRRAA